MHLKVGKLQVEKNFGKINIDEMKPSTRKYPAIIFNQFREAGDQPSK